MTTPTAISSTGKRASKRKRVNTGGQSNQKEPPPAWYSMIKTCWLEYLEQHHEEEAFNRETMKKLMNEILDYGLTVEKRDSQRMDAEISHLKQTMATKEDLQTAIKEFTTAVRGNSYADMIKRDDRDFDPTVPHRPKEDTPKHLFTVKLLPDGDRERSFDEVRDILNKTVQPRQNNIRMSPRISRNGNIVLQFPTAEEKQKAKEILTATPHKVSDRADRKVTVWIQQARGLEGHEDVAMMIRDMNSDMFPENTPLDIKWIGRGEKKKLIINVSPFMANKLLRGGYLYSEMERHPIVLLRPNPFRCGNCLRFHQTKAENCKNDLACRYCGDKHEHDKCPVKHQEGAHRCPTCAHYPRAEGEPPVAPHNAFGDCPTWKREGEKSLDEVKRLLWEAGG